jgi:RHS repeat-associated protein
MQRLAVAVLLLVSFLIPLTAFAICNNCEPNPTSSTYQSTITQRPKSYNARRVDPGDGGPDDGGGKTPTAAPSEVPGSSSYSYSVPILHLPGRNGLDLNLALYYNSRIWTRDMSTNGLTLNADRDWPSFGFRLGYGYIEQGGCNDNGCFYVATEANGAKHQLTFVSTHNYQSTDSTFMSYDPTPTARTLVLKNGTRITYEPFVMCSPTCSNSATLFRPTQIKDSNGNFITIVYVTNTEQSIDHIVDTLGRTINFLYDLNGNLQKISEEGRDYLFAFNPVTVTYTFSGVTVKDTSVSSGSSVPLLTGCTYPNGTGFSFGYGDWGIVNSIQYLSKTGQVRSSQSYDFPAGTVAQSDSPMFTTRTVFDGINTAAWTYAYVKTGNLVSSISVTDPITSNGPQKKVVTTLSTAGDFTQGLVTQTEVLDLTHSNKSMRKSVNAWVNSTGGPLLSAVTMTNDAGQQSKVTYTYDSNGNVVTLSEYDYGVALIRTTATTYSTSYSAQHILDRPTQVLIKDAGGSTVSRTDFAYDGGSAGLASQTGLTTHDDTNYPASFTARGNLTQVTRYSNAAAGTGAIPRTFTYDMLGNLLSADLDCCNKKTWIFDQTTSYAFPASITKGSSPGPTLTTSTTYDSLHRVSTSTDENGQSVTYTYDDANHTDRIVTVTRNTDGATFTTSYDDSSAHPTTQTSNSLNSVVQKSFIENVGSINRLRHDLYNGNSINPVSSVVSYVDPLGRTYKVSNPFGPNDTEVDSTTSFDALNRPVTITPPTNGSSQFAYTGNATQITDPAGKTRKNFSDAFGRLVRVDEPGWADGSPSHATVTITGAEQNYGHWTVCDAKCIQLGGESVFIIDGYDSGTVTLTVNGGASATVPYGQNATPTTLATALVTAINGDSNQLVQAASTGASITLTSKDKDSSANYPLTASVIYDTVHETHASFGVTLPNPANMTGAIDASNGHGTNTPSLTTPMSTGYVYDVLNDLTLVDQTPQTRTYIYDSLGRVKTVKTPETNQIATSFTYDDPGSGQVLKRTDPRGIDTNYSYDGLNRLATISYGDGTPGVTYTYGTTPSVYNNGRLITASDSASSPTWSTTYAYNHFGQLSGVVRAIGSDSYSIGYTYNSDGALKDITYPSLRKVTQTYDGIGRLQKIADSTNTYLTADQATDYNAASQLVHFVYGNGVNANFGYNDHFQVTSISYTKAGQPDLLDLTYNYSVGANNGQIASITDTTVSGDHSRDTAYTYDAWGRLSASQAGTNGATWGYTYDYDRFGNRRNQNPVGTGTQVLLTIDPTTNRIQDSGNGYDANGNMTADTVHNYAYDAENRVKTVDTTAATYSYDDSLRIKKVTGGTTTVYIFSGSKVIAEYAPSVGTNPPTLLKEYVYSGSKLLATLTPNGTDPAIVAYSHSDHLSTRVESSTDANGNFTISRTYGHLPFGETWYETGTASKWKFTSYENEGESSLNYAQQRYQSARLGRFMTLDRLAGSILSPQSLNQYRYAADDPGNQTDPDGLLPIPACMWDNTCGGGGGGMDPEGGFSTDPLACMSDALCFMAGSNELEMDGGLVDKSFALEALNIVTFATAGPAGDGAWQSNWDGNWYVGHGDDMQPVNFQRMPGEKTYITDANVLIYDIEAKCDRSPGEFSVRSNPVDKTVSVTSIGGTASVNTHVDSEGYEFSTSSDPRILGGIEQPDPHDRTIADIRTLSPSIASVPIIMPSAPAGTTFGVTFNVTVTMQVNANPKETFTKQKTQQALIICE